MRYSITDYENPSFINDKTTEGCCDQCVLRWFHLAIKEFLFSKLENSSDEKVSVPNKTLYLEFSDEIIAARFMIPVSEVRRSLDLFISIGFLKTRMYNCKMYFNINRDMITYKQLDF